MVDFIGGFRYVAERAAGVLSPDDWLLAPWAVALVAWLAWRVALWASGGSEGEA
jgi:hypothetical protein